MKNWFHLLTLGAALIFVSCEKVINVDVKNGDQRVIIEGTITDEAGLLSHSVLLSKTKSISSDNERIVISGATVMVEDITIGVKDTLIETKPGTYTTQNIYGISGHTYFLTAIVEGKTYNATSTMPQAVSFDSLYTQDLSFFGETVTQVIPVFQDPAGVKNYYRFTVQVNDSMENTFQAWDDLLSDGKVNSRPLFVSNQDWFKGNDTVTITMDCIDKGTFDFFNTVENATGGGQTPANPSSSISGNGLGYFTALTTRKKTIIVP